MVHLILYYNVSVVCRDVCISLARMQDYLASFTNALCIKLLRFEPNQPLLTICDVPLLTISVLYIIMTTHNCLHKSISY